MLILMFIIGDDEAIELLLDDWACAWFAHFLFDGQLSLSLSLSH